MSLPPRCRLAGVSMAQVRPVSRRSSNDSSRRSRSSRLRALRSFGRNRVASEITLRLTNGRLPHNSRGRIMSKAATRIVATSRRIASKTATRTAATTRTSETPVLWASSASHAATSSRAAVTGDARLLFSSRPWRRPARACKAAVDVARLATNGGARSEAPTLWPVPYESSRRRYPIPTRSQAILSRSVARALPRFGARRVTAMVRRRLGGPGTARGSGTASGRGGSCVSTAVLVPQKRIPARQARRQDRHRVQQAGRGDRELVR